MTDTLSIKPLRTFEAKVRPPGSKSLTNRALVLAALARGRSVLHNPLLADDTKVMLDALESLGFGPGYDKLSDQVVIDGRDGVIPSRTAALHLGNAGTAFRFLTAVCCLGAGTFDLDGVERMRQRPVGQLVQALRQIGANISFTGASEYPPLRVEGAGLAGGQITMPPTLSSQYISALLQVAPCCAEGLVLNFEGPVTSRPYVEMTLTLMARFGIKAKVNPEFTQVAVPPGAYRATEYTIEPDASNASYFLASGAVVPGSKCTVKGLGRDSIQGDVGFADVLHQMGAGLVFGKDFITVMAPPQGKALQGIDVDLNAMPDMAQTLAVVAVFARGPTTIRNIGNLRVKETDRMVALRNELTKLGAVVSIDGDDLTIQPPEPGEIPPATIETYNDHRMAMSFAVAGLRTSGIVINNPSCVDKTFPGFFRYLARLGEAR